MSVDELPFIPRLARAWRHDTEQDILMSSRVTAASARGHSRHYQLGSPSDPIDSAIRTRICLRHCRTLQDVGFSKHDRPQLPGAMTRKRNAAASEEKVSHDNEDASECIWSHGMVEARSSVSPKEI